MHYHFLQHWSIFIADFKMHQLLIMMYSIPPKFWSNLLNFDFACVLFTSYTSMKWINKYRIKYALESSYLCFLHRYIQFIQYIHKILFCYSTRLSFYILHILEVVDQLSCIGTCLTFIFNNSNKFTKAKKHLSDQGQKALFAKLMKLEI